MRSAHIAKLLPETYQATLVAGGPGDAILGAMEALHAPVEAMLANEDAWFDPRRAPAHFVLLLASWLGLDRYFDWPSVRRTNALPRFAAGISRLRELTAAAVDLDRERGTEGGLLRFLRVATGLDGFALESDRPFHLQVTAPAGARRIEDLVRRIVEGERPVYATYDLEFAPEEKSHAELRDSKPPARRKARAKKTG